MEKARRAAEKPKPLHRFAWEPQFVDWKFQEFLRSGGVLCHTHKPMALRITPGTLERALAIANAFCREGAKRGFEVGLMPGDTRIELAGHDVTVQARIVERLERRPVPGRQTLSGRIETTLVPTGQLALSLDGRGSGEIKVSDGSEHPLEEQLNVVFQKIYRAVVRGWREQRRWAAWRREREEAEQRALEEKRRREEEAARLKAEREKVEGLIAEATHWQQAAVIRSYVSQVMDAAGNASLALGEWSRWALEVAARLDPTSRRLSDTK